MHLSLINTESSQDQKGNLRPGEGDGAGFGESEKADADADEEEDEEGEDADSGSKFSVAAGSAFPCSGANTIKMISNLPKDPCERHTHKANNVPPSPAPGYFHLEGTCREFWVCREVCSTFISTQILIPSSTI